MGNTRAPWPRGGRPPQCAFVLRSTGGGDPPSPPPSPGYRLFPDTSEDGAREGGTGFLGSVLRALLAAQALPSDEMWVVLRNF